MDMHKLAKKITFFSYPIQSTVENEGRWRACADLIVLAFAFSIRQEPRILRRYFP